MSGKNVNSEDKKIKKVISTKTKKVFNIDEIDVHKILISKKNHMVQISQLNISLDIVMMLLDHYVYNFLK